MPARNQRSTASNISQTPNPGPFYERFLTPLLTSIGRASSLCLQSYQSSPDKTTDEARGSYRSLATGHRST
ncbi:hypothetical protein TNIN_154401 [Trichonephila inaurata madagascariensis]|uniref:Uncharacterized protein n=1 Tax=Trichonephila inaurata madagascariensis TaxID=2747483 RepID=A0A8X6X3S3_9ARAC|nr:hypothetical protein TNIN_154401 [Trichonephila inaurata madagascariensis]